MFQVCIVQYIGIYEKSLPLVYFTIYTHILSRAHSPSAISIHLITTDLELPSLMYIILDIFIDPVLNFKLHISSIGSKVSNSCSGASLLEWFQSYRNNTNLTGQDSSRETSVVAYPPPPPHADPFSNLPITNGKHQMTTSTIGQLTNSLQLCLPSPG